MTVQHVYLPVVYSLYKGKKIRKNTVIFADAHHNSLPFSMKCVYDEVKRIDNVTVEEFYLDFQKCSYFKLVGWLNKFMKSYATAEYVFICDNFLPVSSCKKRKETKVTQLWHAGGLMKKAGYDCEDSIPKFYKGNVFKNYDLFTVSSENCVEIITKSMRQPEGIVKATGISRSDIYFDEKYNENCIKEFYEKYPQAKGKKIILWAPTFRGTADNPQLVGEEMIDKVFSDNDEYFLVKKLHPHFESKNADRVTCDIPSERLLPVCDLLITDYSSIVFDYLVYRKPFVFFTPDYDEYMKTRGCYVPYESYPTTLAKTEKELSEGVRYELSERNKQDLDKAFEFHMGACDGNSTLRILKVLGIK
ncbi:MAG: CDP-glycerol glycerophosphotransferase family protein [Ruminococcus sp.]|nr:CDP-glycerol glycerophosphotransferase family protein [Ruminococcus sp.]